MDAKKVDALEEKLGGIVETLKSTVNAMIGHFSSMEERFTNIEAMLQKLLELHANSPSTRAADVTDRNVVAISDEETAGGGGGEVVAADLAQRTGKAIAASVKELRRGAEGVSAGGELEPSWVAAKAADQAAGWSGGDARRPARREAAPDRDDALGERDWGRLRMGPGQIWPTQPFPGQIGAGGLEGWRERGSAGPYHDTSGRTPREHSGAGHHWSCSSGFLLESGGGGQIGVGGDGFPPEWGGGTPAWSAGARRGR